MILVVTSTLSLPLSLSIRRVCLLYDKIVVVWQRTRSWDKLTVWLVRRREECEWKKEPQRETEREGTADEPTVVCMGGFHGRKNAVRNSFNCPNSASVLSLLIRPASHTVDTYTYQSFCLNSAPLPTFRRLHLSRLFPANLHAHLWAVLTKMTSGNIFPWTRPNLVKVIYVTLLKQHARHH